MKKSSGPTPKQSLGQKKKKTHPEKPVKPSNKRAKIKTAAQVPDETYRWLFETAQDGLLLLDGDTGIINEANPFIERLLNYPRKEIIGKRLWEINLGNGTLASQKAFRELQEKGTVHYDDLKLETKDGRICNVEFRGNACQVGDKTVIQCNFHEITECVQAEKTRHDREKTYRELFENASMAIFQTTLDGKVITVNAEFARMFGYASPQEILNTTKNAADIFAEPQRRDVIIRLMAENPEPATFENLYRRKDGSTFLGKLVVRLVKDPDGTILYSNGFIEDVTDRKRMEEALRESEVRYRTLAETAHDMIFIVNRQGYVEYINKFAAQAIGHQPKEIIGKPPGKFFPTELFQRQHGNIQKVFQTGEPLYYEGLTRFPSQDAWLGTWLVPMKDESGEIRSVLGISRDTTQSKQVEASLRLRMDQLVALNQVSQAVAASLDLDQVLTEVMDLAGKVAASDYISIVMVDDAGQISRGIENLPGMLSIDRRARKRGFTSWIIHSRRPVVVDEVVEDGSIRPRIGEGAPRAMNPHLVAKGIKSFAGLPLMVDEHIVGVLYLHSLHPGTFHDQMPLLITFANQAAIAIEKARLYYAVQKELAERKQADEALETSHSLLEAAIDSTADGLLMIDSKGKITQFNQKFKELWQIPQEILAGRDDEQALTFVTDQLKNPDTFIAKVKELYSRPEAESFDVLEFKDGRTIERYSQPHYLGGKIVGRVWSFRDVSGRRQAEEALSNSEAQLRALVEEIPAIIYTESADEPGKTIYISPQIEAITGYTPAEWMGSSNFWDVIVHPEDQDYLNAEDERTNRTGEPFRAEYRILKRDGSILWMLDEAVLIHDNAGNALFWQGVMHDISDKKRAEKAQQESEARFTTIFKTSPIGISITHIADGQIIEVNPAFLDMFGFTQNEVIGRTPQELNLWVKGEEHDRLMKTLLNGGLVRNFETKFRRKSGQIGDLLTSAEIIELAGEKHMICVLQDITARKQTEDALSKSEAELRALFAAMPDVVIVLDKNGQYIKIAPTDPKLLYRPPEELLGKTLENVFPRTEATEFLGKIRAALKKKKTVHVEYALPIGEETIWFSASISPMTKDMVVWVARDITERKRADEQIRRSETELKKAQSFAHVGSWSWDIKGNKVEWTDEMYHIFGIPKGKFTGSLQEVISRAIHPDDRQKVEQSNLSVVRMKKPIPLEYRIIWPDHSIHTVWAEAGELILDDAGEPALLKGIVQDITERKRAEEALANERNLLRSLIDNVPDYIYVKDTKAQNVLANMACARRTGLSSPEDMLGKTDFDYFPEELAARYFADDQEVLRSGQPLLQHEEPTVDGAGNPQWISTNKVPLLDGQGKIYGLVGVGRDITESKRVEQALRESEERYRLLFELSPDGIAVYRDGKVAFTNQAAVRLLGATTLGELVERAVMDFVHPDYRQLVLDRTRQQMTEGKIVPVLEEKFLRLDGTVLDVDVTASPIKYKDKLSSMVIFRDISERKRAEEELARQAEELRRRNEELARLYRASGSLITGASLNTQEQAQKIVEVVQQEFGPDNCSLFIAQRDSNELVRLATAGAYADQLRNVKLTLDGDGLVARAMRSGETINVSNVHADPHYIPNWEAAQSEVIIPLKVGSSAIGAIDLQSQELNVFSADDERLMTIFAERAALGLEHSRLNTQTEARIQQLVALRTVDMAISGSFDINLTLGVLLDQITGQLGVHAADILIFNAATQTFKFSCERGFRIQTLRHTQLKYGSGYVWRAVRERQVINIADINAGPDGLQRSPDLSAEQFVAYIGIPLTAKGQIKGILEIFHREPIRLEPESYSFLEILAGQAAIAIDNAELFDNLQSSNSELSMAYEKTLEGWASALELRDHDTEGHTRRTTESTMQLARAMGINDNDILHLYRGALLHDIGKMGLPDSIVLKPGPLTEDEWIQMRKHPQYAYDMLSPISYLRLALDIPYCHHEKWDGTGYPRGLKGEQIPLSARIFAVVDVWDALTSDRPYRKEWMEAKARQYIKEQAGVQFDPEVVKVFLKEIK